MSEVELERLVIRLVGDASNYIKVLEGAAQQTKRVAEEIDNESTKMMKHAYDIAQSLATPAEKYNQTLNELNELLAKGVMDQDTYARAVARANQEMEKATQTVKQESEGMQQFAQVVKQALVALGAWSVGHSAFNAFAELEAVQVRLHATIQTNGEAVEETTNRYNELTRSLEATTTVSKMAIVSLAQHAEVMGRTGDAAERLIKNSIAFAAATHKNAEEGFSLALALDMGNVHMLRFALGLRGVKDDAEILRIAHAQLAAGLRISGDEANTAAGRMKLLDRANQEMMQTLGEGLSKMVMPFIKELQRMIEAFTAAPPVVRDLTMVMSVLAVGFTTVAISLALFRKELSAIQTEMWAMANPMTITIAALSILVVAIYEISEAWTDDAVATARARQELDAFQAAVDKGADAVRKTVDSVKELAPSMQHTAERVQYFKDNIDTAVAKQKEWKEAIAEARKELKYLDADYGSNSEQVKKQESVIASLIQQMGLFKDAEDDMRSALDKTLNPVIDLYFARKPNTQAARSSRLMSR